jgi:hypothetical protein
METEKNVTTSQDKREELQAAQDEDAPRQCKAIAKSTGKRCKKNAVPDSDYCPVHKALAHNQDRNPHTDCNPSNKTNEMANDSEWPMNNPTWDAQATFSLFFGHTTDKQKKKTWYTCVREEPDERGAIRLAEQMPDEEMPEIAIDPWVNWILERTNLPFAETPRATEGETAALSPSKRPIDASIEIQDFQISVLKPTSDQPKKQLRMKVGFQISGPDVETLTTRQTPFHVEITAIDAKNKLMRRLTTGEGTLQPDVKQYESQQTSTLPHLGEYDLYATIMLLTPDKAVSAYRRGNPIRIIP